MTFLCPLKSMQDNISITEKKINENLYTICKTLDYVIIFRINIFYMKLCTKLVQRKV